jgi:hypothetical protein
MLQDSNPSTVPVVIIENTVSITAAEKTATQRKVKPAQEKAEFPPASSGVEKPDTLAEDVEPTTAAVTIARAESEDPLSVQGWPARTDSAPEPRGDTAESDAAGSGKLSIPAQLRRHSRVTRPSKVTMVTPEFIPAPYPQQHHQHHQPSAPSSTGITAGSLTGSVGGSRRSSVNNYPTDFSDISEEMYVMPAMQSIAPSAIIAAARESIRQAERATLDGGGSARAVPPRNRSLRQSY